MDGCTYRDEGVDEDQRRWKESWERENVDKRTTWSAKVRLNRRSSLFLEPKLGSYW